MATEIQGLAGAELKVGRDGVAYFNAVKMCDLYLVNIAEHQHAIQSWKSKLGELNIHPAPGSDDDTVWVPVVVLAPFLISVGAEEHTRAKYCLTSKTLMADLAEMPAELVAYLTAQYRSMVQAMRTV